MLHPVEPDLGFLYGVIFIGPPQRADHCRNVCIFAEGELDRSPTGTGVSGRLAIHYARGDVGTGEPSWSRASSGALHRPSGRGHPLGPFPAIIPEIEGQARLLGRSEYWIDPDDRLGEGFLLR